MMEKDSAYWWWFDSHQHSSKRSPWLQSTLGDLDMKTKTMLKLIEEDADSFAQRAEMYYKKRPELINMVEDFYKTHRSLAERYALLKSEYANRRLTAQGQQTSVKYHQPKVIDQFDLTYDIHSETGIGYPFSTKYQQPKLMDGVDEFDKKYDSRSETGTRASGFPFSTKCQQPMLMAGMNQLDQTYDSCSETGTRGSGYSISTKYQQQKPMAVMDKFDQTYDSHSESGTYETDDSAESEIDDPQHNDETVIQTDMGETKEPKHELEANKNEVVGLGLSCKNEVTSLQEEIERLKEENRIQKEQLLQKDEEKRDVIRQLSAAVEVLKVENDYLRKSATRNPPKKRSLFHLEKLRDVFSGKLFSGSARSQGRVAAL